MKYLLVNKSEYVCEVFKEFWSETHKIVIAKILLLSLLLVNDFQGVYHSYVYVNVISSSRFNSA